MARTRKEFYSSEDLAEITGVDVGAIRTAAEQKRLGYQTQGSSLRSFPRDQAVLLIREVRPHAFVLRSTAARVMHRTARQIDDALASAAAGDLASAGFAPVIEGIGPREDALYPVVAMQRAWRLLDPAAEVASRNKGGRAFFALDELAADLTTNS